MQNFIVKLIVNDILMETDKNINSWSSPILVEDIVNVDSARDGGILAPFGQLIDMLGVQSIAIIVLLVVVGMVCFLAWFRNRKL